MKPGLQRRDNQESSPRARPGIPADCVRPDDVLDWLRTHVPAVSLTNGHELQIGSADALLMEDSNCPWPIPSGFQVLALLALPGANASRPHSVALGAQASCLHWGRRLPACAFPGETAQSGDLAGHYVVIGRQRVARLTALFSSLDRRRDYGRVWLVGFGPGDPDLMTLKAHRALRSADVIFYDDLIDDSILGRYRARSIYVGKRKGRSRGRQEAINRMLYESAVRGETVVRLKGGDPLVLGRGGEEVEYLERRFVSVDVVPGVTSALAAAADFGIPLTLRGVSRGLEIRTGHTECPDVRPGRCETSVYYMAGSRLSALREELLISGFDPDLPAAIVENASLPGRHCRFTTIGKLGDEPTASPALLIVGQTLDSAPRKLTLLYTGSSPYRFRGPERLVHYPLIERRGREEIVPIEKPRIDLSEFDGVVFTHPLAIDQFLRTWGSLPDLVYATSPLLCRRLFRHHKCRPVVHAY